MTFDTNRVFITGRLGQDPQLKKSSNGIPYVRLSVAVHRAGKPTTEEKAQGKYTTATQWQNVMVWGSQAETCARHLVKGSRLLVEGQLDAHDYTVSGSKRHVVQVIASRVQFLSGIRAASVAEAAADDAASAAAAVGEVTFQEGEVPLEQEIM